MRATLLILIALSIAASLAYFLFSAPPEPEPVPTAATKLKTQLRAAEGDRERLETELAEAHERIETLEAELAEARAKVKELERRDTEEKSAPSDESPDASEEAGDEEAKNEAELDLDGIRARLRDNAGAAAQIQAMTEMVYADYLNAVELDPAVKAQVRKLLGESLLESLALGQYAMREGDIPWRQVRAWELEERAYLDGQLRDILPIDAYDTWSAYTEDIELRQLDATLRNQIGAFASGLSDENFEAVMQVAVEEFRAEQAALEESDTPYTMESNVYYQIRAMDTMRERLNEFLPEDQLAEVENWLTMGENVLMGQAPSDAERP